MLVLWPIIWLLGAFEGAYAFFWLTGKWLPWYADILFAVLQPVTFFVWLILWLAHFVPSVVFPVIH